MMEETGGEQSLEAEPESWRTGGAGVIGWERVSTREIFFEISG
jgi:hypothetical protein